MTPTIHHRLQRRGRRPDRRGATMIETALIIMMFLTLVIGMLDFGIAVYRYNLLSEASRQLARKAIVHGKLANQLGSWGTSTYNGNGSNNDAIALAVRPYLVGLNPAKVTIQVRWPDSSNDVDKNVHTTLSTTYKPLATWIFAGSFTLKADSEMQIAH